MVSPSLASTAFRGCVNSAGMAKNVKKKKKQQLFIAVYFFTVMHPGHQKAEVVLNYL